jgi:phosphohistidine phosphatase
VILMLLRHGLAEDPGPDTGYHDEPRRLTHEGVERMRAAAEGMAVIGLAPRVVLHSPYPRCAETARIVSERIGGQLRADPRLRPGMRPDDLAEALAGTPDSDGEVLVCGHQPDLSQAAAALVGGGNVEFKKGALAVIELGSPRPGAGVLRALSPPATLRRLGAGG